MVKRLDAEAQHRLAASNQLGEVINAQDMAPGEAVTVDRGGWLSEHDLVISGGPGMAVAVRCSTEGLRIELQEVSGLDSLHMCKYVKEHLRSYSAFWEFC